MTGQMSDASTVKPVFRNVLQQATAEWVTAILAYYRRRKNLTGIYMRGYFAGMADREVLELATQLHESSIKYPACSEGEPVSIDTLKHLHVIEKIGDLDDIVTLEDGYQYFMPKSGGAMSASVLRIIAAELDRRNAVWDEQVQKELARLADNGENKSVCDLG